MPTYVTSRHWRVDTTLDRIRPPVTFVARQIDRALDQCEPSVLDQYEPRAPLPRAIARYRRKK